jgi:hypothetical protein
VRLIALVIAATSAALGGMPANAQEPASDARMVPMPDGFLEIDGRSGVVRECRRELEGYRYVAVSPNRDAAQAEIERLAKENAELRERLARLGDGQGVKPPPTTKTPSDEDVDRALGFMEKFIRRFLSILREETPDRT